MPNKRLLCPDCNVQFLKKDVKMLFRFEVSASVAQDFKKLVATSSYLGDTPRTLVSKLIAQAVERLESAAPKEPERKQSAAEIRQEKVLVEREARAAALIERCRTTGIWPRFNAPTSAEQGIDYFNLPVDERGKYMISPWTPPEDYPHFQEMDMKRGEWARVKEPEMTGRPKLEDFNGDEEAHFRAEMAWLKKDWTE